MSLVLREHSKVATCDQVSEQRQAGGQAWSYCLMEIQVQVMSGKDVVSFVQYSGLLT